MMATVLPVTLDAPDCQVDHKCPCIFSTLQQMLGGNSYNASKDSPAQNPVVIPN